MNDTRRYLLESVDDAAVVQLYADGFSALDVRDKILVWHLYLAAIAGRDIYYDQRYAHNLEMRALLEAMLTHGASVDPRVLGGDSPLHKLFWINTGPYNNLDGEKVHPASDAR
jgi:dipeptidyl-peptidase-3